jgi:hypothetical protein
VLLPLRVLASRNLYFHNPIVSHNPLIYFRAGLLRRVRERARDGEGDLPRFLAASFDGVLQAGKKKTSIFVLWVSLSLLLSLLSFFLSLSLCTCWIARGLVRLL